MNNNKENNNKKSCASTSINCEEWANAKLPKSVRK